MPFGKYSYLIILLGWALPVLLVQWLVAGRALWKSRRLIVATFLLCGTYLSLADHFAIARGIWQIQEAGIIGWRLQGHLPLEEAMFFYLTVLMSAQGFVMIAGHFAPKDGVERGRSTLRYEPSAMRRVPACGWGGETTDLQRESADSRRLIPEGGTPPVAEP